MDFDYIINSDTLAIIPLKPQVSKVMEKTREYIVSKSVLEIVNDSCKYFGSSLEGRQAGSKYLLNVSYKLPIIIDESRELIFFPTTSPNSPSCIWICVNHVDKYYRQEENCLLFFENQIPLLLPISFGSFENQYYRASKLLLIIKNKKIGKI